MIKIVYDIKVYREGLRDIVKEDDVVVELGCHVGNSTRIISQMAPYGRIISLDKSSQSEEKMQELTKEEGSLIEFIKGDVRLHEVLEEVAEKVNKMGVVMSYQLIWVGVTIRTLHLKFSSFGHQL